MRSIHPFPARMASDTVSVWLNELPKGARIVDPMCGSGLVVRQSAALCLSAHGFDVDPLAVLMSSVWTQNSRKDAIVEAACDLVQRARKLKYCAPDRLPWIGNCPETLAFVRYWFAEPQRNDLVKLAWLIHKKWQKDCPLGNALKLSLSKIIVTKQAGASLAWDVSHSRPHKVGDDNQFDVLSGFFRAATKLSEIVESEQLPVQGKIALGDCRNLTSLNNHSIDAVVTSPPYLNAIDYLRGHKFALVWLGYTIPALRNIRANAVGTERCGFNEGQQYDTDLEKSAPTISKLPQRQRKMVHRYAKDASLFLKEMKRIMKPDGLMVLVLGDSNLRGIPVQNSRIFRYFAEEMGFFQEQELLRPLEESRRYLPICSNSSALANRMKVEVLQVYRSASNASAIT